MFRLQALEGLTQAVLAGNVIQQKMLEVQWMMLAAVNKTNDQLEKVEVAIRRQKVLPPTPPPPAGTVTIGHTIIVETSLGHLPLT